MSQAVTDVLFEVLRQRVEEKFTSQHDDEHDPGELSSAAVCYALNAASELYPHSGIPIEFEELPWWPWDKKWWKPKTPRRDLVRAAALLLAEIEKMDRKP